MKSFEKQLAENCPAIFDLHKGSWEQDIPMLRNIFAPQEKLPEPEPIVEAVIPENIEWQTTSGKRVINSSFINSMTAGY